MQEDHDLDMDPDNGKHQGRKTQLPDATRPVLIKTSRIHTCAAGCRQLRGFQEAQGALAGVAHDGVFVGLSHGGLLGARLASRGTPHRAHGGGLRGGWSLHAWITSLPVLAATGA